MSKGDPEPHVVAALVHMRQSRGQATAYGDHGKGVYRAHQLGFVEQIATGFYELNLRGQDIADEAIQLAKGKRK